MKTVDLNLYPIILSSSAASHFVSTLSIVYNDVEQNRFSSNFYVFAVEQF